MNRILLLFLVSATLVFADELPTDDGFRGIWYSNQPTKDEYRFKYSGGMATYPQQHAPIAIYSAAANKTFSLSHRHRTRAPLARLEKSLSIGAFAEPFPRRCIVHILPPW